MKFLIDAQLPRRLAHRLVSAGHDALHTLDLPAGNRTTDDAICDIADSDGRVVITKDADSVLSFLVASRPRKLLLVSTGNNSNAELETHLLTNLPTIVAAFDMYDYIELSRTKVIVHA